MAEEFDEATGPEAGLGQFNLNPGFGLDPSTPIRAVSSVTTSNYPETTTGLPAPVSTTLVPRGAKRSRLRCTRGGKVDLAPPNR
jgi:hypothetical protein